MRKILSAALLMLFYLALVLGIAEIGTRVTRAAPPVEASGWFWKVPDATTGWALQPNTSGRSYNPLYEYDVSVAINSRGLRAYEFIDYAKPDDVYRVIVLGDSFVEAMQVELQDSFPQQLGSQIAAATGQRVEVLNAGVGGWGNDQQLLWLKEEGYKYSPDLIVLAVYPRNDFMNNSELLESTNQGRILKPFYHLENGELRLNYFPFNPDEVPEVTQPEAVIIPDTIEDAPLVGVGEWLHNHSAFYRYVDPRIRIASPRFAAWLGRIGLIEPGQESKVAAQPRDYVPLAYNLYHRQLDADWQAAVDVTTAIFAEFQRTAVGMGADTGAILITAPEQVYADDWSHILDQFSAMRAWDLDMDGAHRLAVEALNRADVPVLDLLPIFRNLAQRSPRLHLEDDGHWTVAGHDLAARATFNFLAEQGIVPALGDARLALTIPVEGRSWWEWFVLAILLLLVGSLIWDMIKTGPLRWLRKAGAGVGTAGELIGYMAYRRQYVLLPLVIILLMFAGILILAQASVVGPFIYTLI
ncbi:MAG: SGNH/GDSL hydrolase family protein [Caldilineaceae bacterium]|nr:SGNH/GDSL hydrolase family protein [Caldilineaceae bacterium]